MELLVAGIPAAPANGQAPGILGTSPGSSGETGACEEAAGAGFSLLLQLLLSMSPGGQPANAVTGGDAPGTDGTGTPANGAGDVQLMVPGSSDGTAGTPLLTLTELAARSQSAGTAQAGSIAGLASTGGEAMAQTAAQLKAAEAGIETGQQQLTETALQSGQTAASEGKSPGHPGTGENGKHQPAENQQVGNGDSAKTAVTAGEQVQSTAQGKTVSAEEFAQLLNREGLRMEDKAQQLHPAATRSPVDAALSQAAVRQSAQTARTAAPAAAEAPQVSQIARDISAQLLRGNTEMRIALKPEHLGEMRVRIVLEADNVTMSMRVESAPVKAMLEANAGQLREALLQHGIRVGGFDVDVHEHNVAHQEQSFEGFFRQAHDSASTFGREETGPVVTAVSEEGSGVSAGNRIGRSAVDYFA